MTSPTADSSATASRLSDRPPSRVPAWIQNRWVQGTAAGVLTLVPVRKYPEWLRQAIMWVPAAGITTVLVTPRIWEAMADAGRTSPEDRTNEQGEPEQGERGEPPAPEDQATQDQKPPLTPRGRMALWCVGLTVGASVYGYMRFSLWADGAIEDKLRELGVARPRIVMAVLGGLVAGATGGAPEQQGRRVGIAEGEPRLAASV
ncbi:hypothetical protein I2485_02565 [Nesterenkonia sp. E16_7]|uniref:hypothetical protein n=1 Tax=unclassified Nesterenkonia TaxID=2629769 RepID=UPI001A939833|nr:MULTISPECIES: hypothetical protein [unclassified Nesterenkonia]MBO0594085.1 hypothetical protein [Nesterenkonia sp. E16_10]MBO0597531.1 hypothetical protein [Nesterenkonia sp. E16_7]